MKPDLRPGLLTAALLLASSAGAAQAPDARVLPRGMMELRVLGTFTQFGSRLVDGGSEPLGAGFDALIAAPAGRLAGAAADSVSARLAGFYARTQSATAGDRPLEVRPGTPRARLSADLRDAPATLALGVTSRLTVEVTASLHRRGTVVRGIVMEGATFGINPDRERNAAILQRADTLYARIVGDFLPLRGSAAGRELQRRVQALAGDTLTLPTEAAPVRALLNRTRFAALDTAEALMLRAGSGRTPYHLGDTYVGARVQLSRGPDGWALPSADSAFRRGVRATGGARLRIPTGARSAVIFPLQLAPEGGHWGVGGDLVADWFPGRRWWITAGAAAEVRFAADVERLAFSAAESFPDSTQRRTLRLQPGSEIRASLAPRYRLTREIALAAQYTLQQVGAATLTGTGEAVVLGPIERTDALTAHTLGFGISYSTLTAYRLGESPFPAEVSATYRTTVAGSGYAPRAGAVELVGRLFAPVYGRGRRPAPAAPPAPASGERLPATP